MSETALQFTGTDLRGLLDVLLEALKVIRRTGRRPTITVNGKLYANHDLRKLAALLPDEDLQPHHQASGIAATPADEVFGSGTAASELRCRCE